MNWRFWDRTGGAGGDGCTAIEPLLSLYTDGMASPAEARRVEAHLKDCDGCRQALGWMQATRRVIAARPAVPPPVDLRSRIARAIAEADGVPAPVRRALPARRPLTLRPALAYGLSFALLAALSGSLFWNAGCPTATAVHPGQAPGRRGRQARRHWESRRSQRSTHVRATPVPNSPPAMSRCPTSRVCRCSAFTCLNRMSRRTFPHLGSVTAAMMGRETGETRPRPATGQRRQDAGGDPHPSCTSHSQPARAG